MHFTVVISVKLCKIHEHGGFSQKQSQLWKLFITSYCCYVYFCIFIECAINYFHMLFASRKFIDSESIQTISYKILSTQPLYSNYYYYVDVYSLNAMYSNMQLHYSWLYRHNYGLHVQNLTFWLHALIQRPRQLTHTFFKHNSNLQNLLQLTHAHKQLCKPTAHFPLHCKLCIQLHSHQYEIWLCLVYQVTAYQKSTHSPIMVNHINIIQKCKQLAT